MASSQDSMASSQDSMPIYTRILPVNENEIGRFAFSKPGSFLDPWTFEPSAQPSGAHLLEAADALHTSLYPVAFPTETVYGLGANALSSPAVRGIYAAKQRPADNPLIVHVSSLEQLRKLLARPGEEAGEIPAIYTPLIKRFWPGPLSMLLPNPQGSRLAPEVTAGQPTFAARMPSNKLALALIQLSGLPLAAPSANASTRPSPTAAQHVAHDLDGRIQLILDGGPCNVGVESTVVDGLSSPPCILRPGGVGIDEIRACEGWEGVVTAYKDKTGDAESKPRAPGMKYKHYSPVAKVVLVDSAVDAPTAERKLHEAVKAGAKIGVVRTRSWPPIGRSVNGSQATAAGSEPRRIEVTLDGQGYEVWDVFIGPSAADVARGLFSALRELDLRGVEAIFVEGIQDEGETAAAVTNRLSKAASERITPAG